MRQAGGSVNCTFSLNQNEVLFGAVGGTGSISVTASNGACGWSGESHVAWMSITSGSPGIGSGTLGYSVSANNDGATRIGTLTIAGHTYTVTQSGLPQTLPAPVSLSATVAGNLVTATWTMPRSSRMAKIAKSGLRIRTARYQQQFREDVERPVS